MAGILFEGFLEGSIWEQLAPPDGLSSHPPGNNLCAVPNKCTILEFKVRWRGPATAYPNLIMLCFELPLTETSMVSMKLT